MPSIGVHPERHPLIPQHRPRLTTAVFFGLLIAGLGTSTTVAVAASPVCSAFVRTYVDRLVPNLVSNATLKRWHNWGVGHPTWRPNPLAHRARFKKVRDEVSSLQPIACPAFVPPQSTEIALLTPDLNNFLLTPDAPDYNLTGPSEILPPVVAVPGGTGAGPAAGILAPPIFIFGALPPISGGPGVGTPVVPPGTGPTPSPVPITPVTPVTPVPPPPVTPITPVTPIIPITPVVPIGPGPLPTPTPIPAPVPEPNSILLTLTGMIALGGLTVLRRRTLNPIPVA